MKEEIRQAAEAIASHPKTSALIVASPPIYSILNSLNPILDFLTSVLGIVLVGVLIRYHWQNTKKVMKENE